MIDPNDFEPISPQRFMASTSSVPTFYVRGKGLCLNRALVNLMIKDVEKLPTTAGGFGKVYLELSYNRVHKAFRITISDSSQGLLFHYRPANGTLLRYSGSLIDKLGIVRGAYLPLKDQPDVFVLDVSVRK